MSSPRATIVVPKHRKQAYTMAKQRPAHHLAKRAAPLVRPCSIDIVESAAIVAPITVEAVVAAVAPPTRVAGTVPLLPNGRTPSEFQQVIGEAGIESRPLIGGNLMRQPFLRKHYHPAEFPNADFLHDNAFYIGNNQFVTDERMDALDELMRKFFGK